MKGKADVDKVHLTLNIAEANDLLSYIRKHGIHDGTTTGDYAIPPIREFLVKLEELRR